MKRRSENGMKIAKDSRNKRRASDQDDENAMCSYQTEVTLDNDENDDNLTVAEFLRLEAEKKKKKNCKVVGDASEQLANIDLELALIRPDGDESVAPSEIEKRYTESDEAGRKTGENQDQSLFDENNFLDLEVVASPPKLSKTSADEVDHVYGSNADSINYGSKEPTCFLLEEGDKAGEKEVTVVDDDRLIQKKLMLREQARKVRHDNPRHHQKLASGSTYGDETSKTSNKCIVLSTSDEKLCSEAEKEDDGDRLVHKKLTLREQARKAIHDDPSHRQKLASGSTNVDTSKSMIHDDGMEKAMKPNEQLESLEKRNDESYEKRLHKLKVTMALIEERISMAERNVEWLKERRAMKQRKLPEDLSLI